ncbi:conserved hypothetical protein [Nostocoides japonicum T1-X7]|uniref:Glycosyltransferase subfamily 4-like N-terminal domain-containing protein n=1 Tax=Nostocoides japonicum T1-X7 TaxID=1194083 RepID=A0A077LWT5_9MICO|nr:glycosyltransferase family 4 protein [Tetrasphaera japonica]CCH78156.1 conserved hypothetical protein [Tetrasphaera japonica T1-X7]
MIGQKGLPASYGGVEHVVSETGRRLADRGHRVTVFTRTTYANPPTSPYFGMEVVPTPALNTKHLDAISHSATSTTRALFSGCDIFHYHALGPGLMAPLPRALARGKVVLTVHGLDHERAKWGLGARAVLGLAHWMSPRVPDRTIVVSKALQQHYAEQFDRPTDYIPNGVTAPSPASVAPVEDFGLRPGGYVLQVGRVVPEKGASLLLDAFRLVDRDVQLAIVGDTSWTEEYAREVREKAARDPRVVLTGYAYGDTLRALYANAALFTQPSFVEGLPLTLLEAASHGLPVVCSDIAPHCEVLAGGSSAGRTFRVGDREDLARVLTEMIDLRETLGPSARTQRDEILRRYDWDSATDQLEQVYLELTSPRVAAAAKVPA